MKNIQEMTLFILANVACLICKRLPLSYHEHCKRNWSITDILL